MVRLCDSLVGQCMELCDELIRLAEKGMSACDEEECMLFFGIMLDSAYKLKNAGELRRHALDEGQKATA